MTHTHIVGHKYTQIMGQGLKISNCDHIVKYLTHTNCGTKHTQIVGHKYTQIMGQGLKIANCDHIVKCI